MCRNESFALHYADILCYYYDQEQSLWKLEFLIPVYSSGTTLYLRLHLSIGICIYYTGILLLLHKYRRFITSALMTRG